MSKKVLQSIKPALAALPADQVMLPRIPIDTFLQEAHDLYIWALNDSGELQNVGLEKDVLMGLPKRIDALQYAQSLWNSKRRSQHETTRDWERMLERGRELSRELKRTFRFAFRNEELLLRKLKTINQGRTHADLIQDLSDLAVMGKSNLGSLEKVGFKTEFLDEASKLCSEMADALGRKRARDQNGECKGLRDRAFTYLYLAVQEIRAAGRYAFREQPKKLQGYRHKYYARKQSVETQELS